MFLLLLLAFDVPETKPCVVDMCEGELCAVDTPEGLVTVTRKPGYFEGKKLPLDECPVDQIDPT